MRAIASRLASARLWNAWMSEIRPQWQNVRLDDLCNQERGITYGIVKVGDYVPGGVPVIRGGDIRDGSIDYNEEKRVAPSVSEQFSRTILRGGELVLNLIADPGHCAIVPDSMAGFNVSRDVAVIPLLDAVDHRYVCRVLQSPQSISWLTTRLQGSVTQKINLGILRDLPVPLPSGEEQRAIADVLGALDDKIEANRRLVALCDESWRTAAKAEPATEAAPLSRLADFVNGRAFTKGATGSGRMVVRIAELNSGPGASTVYNDLDVGPEHLACPGDLLFAWSGSLTVARWYRDEAIINQHIFKVIPKRGIPIWLIHGALLDLLAYFRGIAADKATTMGHIQRHHLDELVSVPLTGTRTELNQLCMSLWHRALSAEQETLKLAALRDALLPRLLSGEVAVRDVEAAVGEAV
jgi:type I restriction enzyme, S subunit